ncbi:DUF2971 domain-containing protein [Candidatus Nitrotoga fabula]|uniref:DUF2971 domain-containing protein n=1 Tax=Candidatus Nitrotoga fabula TaxID=2182327 RepID=A0A916F9G6_9PROT|nr:DUF2971 domain-containing protein [Candidatus Nitrotoga fabula]CAE6730029.1 hypothetical protein NTGZN8_440001 [Candidatus Nitrotoga fabula]
MLPAKQGERFPPPNHHFRLYNAEYLNDPHEGCRIFQHMKGHRIYDELYRMLFNKLDTESAVTFLHEDLAVYISSCTLRSDRLDLWRAYGNNGDGMCIITPLSAFEDNRGPSYALGEYLKELRKPEGGMLEEMGKEKAEEAARGAGRQLSQTVPRLLYRVKYTKAEVNAAIQDLRKPLQEIANFMQKVRKEPKRNAIRKCVIFLMSDIFYLYKNEEYRNEEEVRLVFVATIDHPMLELDEQNPGRLFLRTDGFLFDQPGSRIIIGPRVKEKRAVDLNLKYRLNRHGFKDTRVMQSKVAYR